MGVIRSYSLREPLEAIQWDGSAEALATIEGLAAEHHVQVGHLGADTLLLVDAGGTRSRKVRPGAYIFVMAGLKVSDGRTFEDYYYEVSDA